ncbi:FtsX-like permease family protein [Lysinibacillus sp. LZ02]|uniref:ABC transporter permease n=1 Tax=Lysinibacillus sp. LZ02 TaxID=3420668 RepID=UPI003D35A5A8
MNAITTLCLAQLRKRKIQNGLIVTLIMLSTLLVATSITMLMNTNNMFEKVHRESNGAHQILTMSGEIHNPALVQDWWQQQNGVTVSELIPYRNLSGIKFNETEISKNLYLFMMNTPKTPILVDQLIFAEGEKTLYPEVGSIWIPTSLAITAGISIGDMLEFQTSEKSFKLVVSSIVVDIPYGGPFTTNARIWMNEQDYTEQFQMMIGTDQYMMGLRFDDYTKNQSFWLEFEEYFKSPFLETKMEYEQIASFYLIINKIIGLLIIALGIAMLIISLFIIGFSISDAILADYKNIGIIKSLGLTSKGIILTYILQYGILSIFSIIPGLLMSDVLARVIIEISLSFLKTGDNLDIVQNFGNDLLIGLAILTAVLITAFVYSNKARQVEPVQAIKYGMSEQSNSKLNKRINGSNRMLRFIQLPIQLQIGMKILTNNMKSSILVVMLSSITAAILVFSSVVLNSFVSIKQTAPSWGYDSADIVVTVLNEAVFSKESFEKHLLFDGRIKNYAWTNYFTGVIPREEALPLTISVDAIEDSFDDVGYETIIGRNPSNMNEIAIGVNVARALNKDLGDIIDIYIEGNRHSLIITGIYQSIANMSNSARITAKVINEQRAEHKDPVGVLINVHNQNQIEQVVSSFNKEFKHSISVETQQTLLDTVFKEVITVLMIPLVIIGALFIMFMSIIIFSISRINVRKLSSVYGIYKSIGMTSMNIRLSITLGVFMRAILGSILGIFIGTKVIPLMLKNTIMEYGLLTLPLVINWPFTIIIACISIIVATISCWLATKVIAKTSPRILLTE